MHDKSQKEIWKPVKVFHYNPWKRQIGDRSANEEKPKVKTT